MHTPTRSGTALRAGLSLSLLIVAILFGAGCSNRPDSPEALLLRVAELNGEGRTKDIWALYTEESREAFRQTIDELKHFMERNPDPKNKSIVGQFNISVDELYTLPVIEIFDRENQGREQMLVNARVVDVFPDPSDGRNMIVVWESDATMRPQHMVCRQQPDGSWLLVKLRQT